MFLLRPPIISGESLASWRKRAALANGFQWFSSKAGRLLHPDPDRLPPESGLHWLCREYGVLQAQLRAASLDSLIDTVFAELPSGPGGQWVTNAWRPGRLGETEYPGYCPVCLASDSVPHLRLSWRMAFMTHCPIHRCQLDYACSCGRSPWAAISPRTSASTFAWSWPLLCTACGRTLANPNRRDPVDGVCAMLWNCIELQRLPPMAQFATDTVSFFDELWTVCQLLTRPCTRGLWLRLPAEYAPSGLPRLRGGQPRVERLPPRQRDHVIRAALWLLGEWPNRFATAIAGSSLYRQDLYIRARSRPNRVAQLAHDLLPTQK